MSVRINSIEELSKLLRYDHATERLIWLPRKYGARTAGLPPCRVVRNGYFYIAIKARPYPEHRLIWALVNGEWPAGEIDHIDGDTLNNKPDNLRVVSSLGNKRNSARRKDNTSGLTGVEWLPANGKWRAKIVVNRRPLHLGMFATLEAAAAVRKKAEREFGFHPNHGRAPVAEMA